jgi:hypothetical protein
MPGRTLIEDIAIRHLSGRKAPDLKPPADRAAPDPAPERIAYVRLP